MKYAYILLFFVLMWLYHQGVMDPLVYSLISFRALSLLLEQKDVINKLAVSLFIYVNCKWYPPWCHQSSKGLLTFGISINCSHSALVSIALTVSSDEHSCNKYTLRPTSQLLLLDLWVHFGRHIIPTLLLKRSAGALSFDKINNKNIYCVVLVVARLNKNTSAFLFFHYLRLM